MNPSIAAFTESLAGWLADFYLLATLLLTVAFIGLRWVRQPVRKLTIAWAVMIELGALAVVCALPGWPRLAIVATPSQEARQPVLESVGGGTGEEIRSSQLARLERDGSPGARDSSVGGDSSRRIPRLAPPSATGVASYPPELAATLRSLPALACGVFVSCAGLMVVWLSWGAISAVVLCHRATTAPAAVVAELAQIVGPSRPPRVLLDRRIGSAVALGVLRPTILLPRALAEEGSTRSLRAVLSHEWAHIRNHDLWLLALGRCLHVLLFAHPLYWWLRRRIRDDQEIVADAVAARENRPDYAAEILRWTRLTANLPPVRLSAAVGIWEGPSQLAGRMAMLLDETFRVETAASRRWKLRAAGLLALLGAAISLVTLQPARSPAEQARLGATAGLSQSCSAQKLIVERTSVFLARGWPYEG